MPTSHRPRHAACSGCGDVVLISEHTARPLFGSRATQTARTSTVQLEHADPGPDGEVFDAVDDGCRRPRVAP